MRRRLVFWLCTPLLFGLSAYLFTSGQLRRLWADFAQHPIIDYPALLELGEREMGEVAVARFLISNRGKSKLTISDVQTNCSCTGLEQERDGRFYRLEGLHVNPGEQTELVMRVSVRGIPVGAPLRNGVEFSTNDPTQPRGRITVIIPRVTGGISPSREIVGIGPVPIGEPVRQVLDLWDDAVTPRTIDRVSSTRPERVKARLLPIDYQSERIVRGDKGVLIGRLEITVDTGRAGAIHAKVEIYPSCAAPRPDGIRVFGRVKAPVEASPPAVVLPRLSSSGPIHVTTVRCASTSDKPLVLSVECAPAGTTAELLPKNEPGVQEIQVSWKPGSSQAEDGTAPAIHLVGQTGDQVTSLVLPLFYNR